MLQQPVHAWFGNWHIQAASYLDARVAPSHARHDHLRRFPVRAALGVEYAGFDQQAVLHENDDPDQAIRSRFNSRLWSTHETNEGLVP